MVWEAPLTRHEKERRDEKTVHTFSGTGWNKRVDPIDRIGPRSDFKKRNTKGSFIVWEADEDFCKNPFNHVTLAKDHGEFFLNWWPLVKDFFYYELADIYLAENCSRNIRMWWNPDYFTDMNVLKILKDKAPFARDLWGAHYIKARLRRNGRA